MLSHLWLFPSLLFRREYPSHLGWQDGDISPPSADTSDAELEASSTSYSEVTFPAAPLTRAFQSRSSSSPRAHFPIKRWQTLMFDVVWIGMLIIGFGLFTYHQSDVSITQVVDARLIEFKFDHDLTQHKNGVELADGIIQKLAADVDQVTDYRIRLSKTRFASGILPGKTVTVLVKDHEGKTYLDLDEVQDKYFHWVDTMIGNIKNSLRGTYHAISKKDLPRYLGEFCFRFNYRFRLEEVLDELLGASITTPPMPYRLLKLPESF